MVSILSVPNCRVDWDSERPPCTTGLNPGSTPFQAPVKWRAQRLHFEDALLAIFELQPKGVVRPGFHLHDVQERFHNSHLLQRDDAEWFFALAIRQKRLSAILPIIKEESWNSLEFLDVVGHHCHSICKGCGSDQEIPRSDRLFPGGVKQLTP